MTYKELNSRMINYLYKNNLMYDFFNSQGYELTDTKIEGEVIRTTYTKYEENIEIFIHKNRVIDIVK